MLVDLKTVEQFVDTEEADFNPTAVSYLTDLAVATPPDKAPMLGIEVVLETPLTYGRQVRAALQKMHMDTDRLIYVGETSSPKLDGLLTQGDRTVAVGRDWLANYKTLAAAIQPIISPRLRMLVAPATMAHLVTALVDPITNYHDALVQRVTHELQMMIVADTGKEADVQFDIMPCGYLTSTPNSAVVYDLDRAKVYLSRHRSLNARKDGGALLTYAWLYGGLVDRHAWSVTVRG